HLAALLGDRERARTMGLAARERAAARFDRHQVVRAYEDLYRDLIHEDVPCPE
ncbi:MAG: glycosyltransferase involved in cell wall biosynthesis, partial [Planctomycetota bacterium]